MAMMISTQLVRQSRHDDEPPLLSDRTEDTERRTKVDSLITRPMKEVGIPSSLEEAALLMLMTPGKSSTPAGMPSRAFAESPALPLLPNTAMLQRPSDDTKTP